MKNNSMAVGAIALLVGLAVGYFALSGQKEIVEVEKVVEVEAKADTNPVNIRVQAVIGMQTTEVKMLKDFMADVTKLTDGEVTFEVLPAGAVVGVKETLDAVDSGLVDGGFAWTHYWSGKHPAAMLFGSPVAGAGVGIDNIAFLSWFLNAGGKELYERLWDEMGMNVKGFMLQPVGPEALGWFKEPINSMDDFRKYRFRTPPGLPGQSYKDIGVASVAMGGGDILPALEKGTIDAAEWCCPKPDMDFGFHKVLKHYYLQGLHQVVVNADMYLNKDVYNSLTDHQKNAFEVAANASLIKGMSARIYDNGVALHELTTKHGVILQDTPADYFPAYMNAAKALLEKNSAENAFFAEVWQSQKDFAEIAVPFWSGAQTSNAKLGMAFANTLK
ncbi:TRAP transporter substrate-binding protein [Candidatus Puniceispirillum sp.]|jgi:TRAP-type mannitol/chloroaromatic compound transport system substrate-binding protein|uniref:TRAP transporter substrate-binding protein n=1 Tax=Candidatus Puniceispirillum sp. TaxID=2026719 RepID=UPI002FCE2E51